MQKNCIETEIPEFIKKKYQFDNFEELCTRISKKISELSPDKETIFYDMLYSKRFCPAGNTILAGKIAIRPNCCVLPSVTESNLEEILKRAENLWKTATGTGFYLGDSKDPINIIKTLLDKHKTITFENRCQRGNMMVLPITHPKIYEFIEFKSKYGDEYYAANFSVSFETQNDIDKYLLTESKQLIEISKNALISGCPGILFMNRFNENKEDSKDMCKIKTTVPCGELGLKDNESCNLGAINLNCKDFFDDDNKCLKENLICETVEHAVEFLDNVIDLQEYIDKDIEQTTKKYRRIGLGIAGWADLLYKMNLKYDSEEAILYAKKISELICNKAKKSSENLAKIRGPYMKGKTKRNISVTCIQPTGTITSLLGNKGYCIEPFFEDAIKEVSIAGHIKMQAAWQSNVENSISKTINLSFDTGIEQVKSIFKTAYKENCKSITVYRDKSRINQPKPLAEKDVNIKCISCL